MIIINITMRGIWRYFLSLAARVASAGLLAMAFVLCWDYSNEPRPILIGLLFLGSLVMGRIWWRM